MHYCEIYNPKTTARILTLYQPCYVDVILGWLGYKQGPSVDAEANFLPVSSTEEAKETIVSWAHESQRGKIRAMLNA